MKYLKTFENHNITSEKDENSHISYYAFDWDDNILNMPTDIHMERLVDDEWIPTTVSTVEFAEVRSDSVNWRLGSEPFSEFRDSGPRGENAFIEDMKTAIANNKLGPVWDDFIECLVNGCLFAIITARGHEAPTMRKGIEWIIDNVLTEDQAYEMYNNLGKFLYLFKNSNTKFDRILRGVPSQNSVVKDYLDKCDYVGVSAPSRGGSPANPEKAKEDALMEFNDRVNQYAKSIGREAKIGFSDDDLKNVKHIEDLIENLHKERFSHIASIVVKGTKDPNNISKKVRTFESQAAGMESSILPFTSFNVAQGGPSGNFTPGGNEDRQDDYANVFKKNVKKLSKFSGKICKDCECEKCECDNGKCSKTTCKC